MKIQRIITLRLAEICFLSPGADVLSLPLHLLLPPSPSQSLPQLLSLSLLFFLPLLSIHSPTIPPTSKLSGCCLLRSKAEWGDLAAFPSPRFLQPFLRAHMFMHQISALCVSPRQGTSSTLDWCTLAAPCVLALREKGDGRKNRRKERERMRESRVKRKWFSDFLHRLCGPGRLFMFLSPLVRTRGEEIVLSTAWGLCWAYIFKPPLFLA